MGNALTDVLAMLSSDKLLEEANLPKGSMTLINEEKLQQINRYFSSMDVHLALGGSAGNTIRGLACLGTQTGFIGKVGDDEYGRFYRKNLQERGTEAYLLTSQTLPSGVASTFISTDGERTFGTYLGAAAAMNAEELNAAMFKDYTYFYVEGYIVQDHNLMLRAIELAKEAGLQVCIDLASYNIVDAEREFFSLLINKYVDIVFANEEEARAFTGKEPEPALDELGRKCSVVVIKMGAKGSLIRKGTEMVHLAVAKPVKAVDTTGAGDYYAAGFLYGLTCGYQLERCGKIGALLAERIIQVVGAELPDTAWEEIKTEISRL
jgi:sugar/nucleoside kinase (ribokinase family)